MFLKRQVITVGLLMILAAAVCGQNEQKRPAKPIRPYVVTPARSITDIQKELGSANKAQDIMGGAGLEVRVAIQHEKNSSAANAEVHDASDDAETFWHDAIGLVFG